MTQASWDTGTENPCLNPKTVEQAFLRLTGMNRRELIDSQSRTPIVARPRMELMWLMRELTALSYAGIGNHIGGRDVTTIVNGVQRTAARMAADAEYRAKIEHARAFILDSARVEQDWAEAGPPEDVALGLARRLLTAEGQSDDVRALATVLLTVAAVLRSQELPDAEARLAALTLIRNAGGGRHG